jgi:hypothetical protein
VARERIARQDLADVTANKTRWIMEAFLFPEMGGKHHAVVTDLANRTAHAAARLSVEREGGAAPRGTRGVACPQ